MAALLSRQPVPHQGAAPDGAVVGDHSIFEELPGNSGVGYFNSDPTLPTVSGTGTPRGRHVKKT